MSRLSGITPWKSLALAAFVALAVGACTSTAGSGSSASASSSSSAAASASAPMATASATAPATASAPAAAGSGAQISALCQDLATLRSTAASFAHLSPSTATQNTVTADAELMTTELNDIAHAANGQFAPQVDALKSALTTMRSQLKGLANGTASVSSVTNAAKNVKARADDLATATKNTCPAATSSAG